MKELLVLYPEGERGLNTVACIVGTVEIFNRAETYWLRQGRSARCRIRVAGTTEEPGVVNGFIAVRPDVRMEDIERPDLVIIPSAQPSQDEQINRTVFEWIARQYRNGSEIASMCSGAFFLASSGLLDGRDCATHWSLADVFRERFPKVKLRSDKLITDENGIYTNGGAYSFLNLVIYLVEKYYDRETAIYCAKVFQVEPDRSSQSVFAIFSGQKQHEDDLIRRAQSFIEGNVGERISMEALSAQLAIGRRHFDRRFLRATGNTPLEYMQRVKIEAAKNALEHTRKTVSEIMYEVGYSDQKAFRDIFRKVTGLTPLEYKGRYHRDRQPG